MIRLLLQGFRALTTERTLLCDIPTAADSPAGVEWKPGYEGAYACAGIVPAGARVEWRPYVAPGSCVRAWCAAHQDGDPAVTIRIVARNALTSVSVSLTTTGASRPRDLRLDLPEAFAGEIVVSLEVDGAPHARAIVSDARIERTRTIGETTRAAVAAVRLF